jgi:hypothetical protein
MTGGIGASGICGDVTPDKHRRAPTPALRPSSPAESQETCSRVASKVYEVSYSHERIGNNGCLVLGAQKQRIIS